MKSVILSVAVALAFAAAAHADDVRSTVYLDPANPPPAARPTTPTIPPTSLPVAPSLHKHRCPTCGLVWAHDDASRGNVAEHTCRGCGELVWAKYAGPERPAAKPNGTAKPIGSPPGAGYEWAELPGIGWGWVHEGVDRKAFAATRPASVAARPNSSARFSVPAVNLGFTGFGRCVNGNCPQPGRTSFAPR